MSIKPTLLLLISLLFLIVILVVFFITTQDVALLNPKGYIAQKQFELIKFAVFLGLFIIIPVFSLTFFTVWKYREENKDKNFFPSFGNDSKMQVIFWLIPLIIILVLTIITWKYTHLLDPFKSVASEKPPIVIQVVALRWKWLFIYPEQGIASVNFVQFPKKTPVQFKLTADEAPMNSFWIPKLGGQMYAMTGMQTQLNLIADSREEFSGSAAEISGAGFGKMRFTAKSSTEEDFEKWVNETRSLGKELTQYEYDKLLKPSEGNPVEYFSIYDDLYNVILAKYQPQNGSQINHYNHTNY